VLLSVEQPSSRDLAVPSSCDSDAVTAAIDAEAELISAPSPSRSARAGMKSKPGPADDAGQCGEG
jgi:hypothetical protein